jgi:hypothetical protein
VVLKNILNNIFSSRKPFRLSTDMIYSVKKQIIRRGMTKDGVVLRLLNVFAL